MPPPVAAGPADDSLRFTPLFTNDTTKIPSAHYRVWGGSVFGKRKPLLQGASGSNIALSSKRITKHLIQFNLF